MGKLKDWVLKLIPGYSDHMPADYCGEEAMWVCDLVSFREDQETKDRVAVACVEELTAGDPELAHDVLYLLASCAGKLDGPHRERLAGHLKTITPEHPGYRNMIFAAGRYDLPGVDWFALLEANLLDREYALASYAALERQDPARAESRLGPLLARAEGWGFHLTMFRRQYAPGSVPAAETRGF